MKPSSDTRPPLGVALVTVLVALHIIFAFHITSASAALAEHPNYNDQEEPTSDETDEPLSMITDIPDSAGRIIGSPQAGPPPEHPGDRGGSLQLITFAVLVVSLGFIIWRVVQTAKTSR